MTAACGSPTASRRAGLSGAGSGGRSDGRRRLGTFQSVWHLRELRAVPVALGLVIPAGLTGIALLLGGREPPGALGRFLRWLGLLLLLRWDPAHQRADGPGQRLLVAVKGVVVGGLPPLRLALDLVVAVAVEPVDELAQHTRVDPAVAPDEGQEPGLHLVDHAGFLVDGQGLERLSGLRHGTSPCRDGRRSLLRATADMPRLWRCER